MIKQPLNTHSFDEQSENSRNYFSKGLTPQQEDALSTWKAEQILFSDESILFQRMKRALPPREECNPYQLVTFETARLRYSQAAKRYNRARRNYQAVINPAREAAQETMKEFMRLVQSYDAASFSNARVAREERKQKEKFENDPKVQELIEKMKQKQLAEEAEQARRAEDLGLEDRIDIDVVETFPDSDPNPKQ